MVTWVNGDLGDKWQVVITQTPEVVDALTMTGSASLACYAAASAACLMLLVFSAQAVGQWWAVRAVVDRGNSDERLIRRAHNLQRSAAVRLLGSLLLCTVALALAAGLVELLPSMAPR